MRYVTTLSPKSRDDSREPLDRYAARVVVVDRRGRVLLFHQPDTGTFVWATPGGGINENETPHHAARRELYSAAVSTLFTRP